MNNDFTSAVDQIVNQMIAEGRGNDIGAFREKCMKLKVKSADAVRRIAERMLGAASTNRGYYTANTSNGEWYTPSDIIERARWVMHGIDLDPYSSDDAQRTVQASHYFTAQTDGILSDWPRVRSIWVNPPYGKGLIDPCITRLIAEYDAGAFQTGIVLINNATETTWFQALTRICMGGCMFARRIDFVDGSGGQARNKNTRGQIALYIGDEQRRFDEAFRELGRCFDLT